MPGNCYNGYLLLIVRNVGKPVENADSYLHPLVFRGIQYSYAAERCNQVKFKSTLTSMDKHGRNTLVVMTAEILKVMLIDRVCI